MNGVGIVVLYLDLQLPPGTALSSTPCRVFRYLKTYPPPPHPCMLFAACFLTVHPYS